MSAYSNQQFCVGGNEVVRLTLRQHPDLPHQMLTIRFGPTSEFTLSAENDQLRAIVREIAALFEGPALTPSQERTVTTKATP